MGLGVADLARSYRTYRHVIEAAREGARAALLEDATEESVSGRIRSRLVSSGLDPEEATITLRCGGMPGICREAGSGGRLAEVAVRYPHRFPFFSGVLQLFAGESAGTIALQARVAVSNR
jgi:hypothetical protein